MTNRTAQSSRDESGGLPGLALKKPADTSIVDLEKGQSPVSDYEHKKGPRHPNVRSRSFAEHERKSDRHDTSEQHKGRKHWTPGKAWFILVFLGLGACWIPAILAWTKFPGARVWGVELLFWSIWLSILWAGWWFALVISFLWHRVLLMFVRWLHCWSLESYVNWLEYLHGYIALVAWTVALWISWVPLIEERQIGNTGDANVSSSRSVRAINLGGRLLFALAGCTIILLTEKITIQWIAMKFHRRSYRRRIKSQIEAVEAFNVLFSLIQDSGAPWNDVHNSFRGLSRFASERLSGRTEEQGYDYHNYTVDRTPTSKLRTALNDVPRQIFGTSTLDHDDVVGRAFHSHGTEKMERLARKIWNNFVDNFGEIQPSGTPFIMTKGLLRRRLEDTKDQDGKLKNPTVLHETWNAITGGVPHIDSITEGEFMRRCSDIHAEQRRLEETMSNLQNVVGRLDDYLMVFWVVGTILIFAAALDTEIKTLLLGIGGSLIVASWLIKNAGNEVFSSIVFLFSKHPFDVEDHVIIKGKRYKVVEMRLLSTVFHDDDCVQVQAPNSLLNTLFIHNLRRSPATSEPFTIEISDLTTQTQLDGLRARMIKFVKDHPKDYRGDFELEVRELQLATRRMVLYMEIKYNNNWESKVEVRAKRRNDWIFCLRESLDLEKIQRPGPPSLNVTTAQSPSEKGITTV